MQHLLIVGGGIAGLSTAYYAQKQAQERGLPLRITLIEKDTRTGGKIVTDAPDGFVIEGGPDSFITQKPWALQLCRELGLSDHLLGTNDARRKTFILRQGHLREMPDGMMLVVPTRFLPFALSPIISWPGKLRMALDLFIPPRMSEEDESLADFMRRRLGQEALDVLGEPMMAGIHVADAETMSLKATFPRFIQTEQKYGSLIRGMLAAKKMRPATTSPTSLFMTLNGGLTKLVQALQATLNIDLQMGVGVQSVEQQGEFVRVVTNKGTVIEADAVILATPAYAAANMLETAPFELTDLLNGIRYVSTATVSLGFRKSEVTHPLDGFGFVIPRTEKTSMLACTWTSTKFDRRAPDDYILLRAFVGGTRNAALVDLDDTALVAAVREDLARIMNITADPVVSRIFRWNRANPQYDVGHLDRVDRIEALLPPGIFLTGSAYRGVGIPDCVHQGQQTAEKVVEMLSQRLGELTVV